MSFKQHLVRITLLMIAALGLLTWLASHTEVMFADGLRYIALAQAIDQGSWREGLAHAVDHPVYSLSVVAAHRVLGGFQPEDWQTAAQAASIVAGVLLIIPLYLFALELHGPAAAWLACVLSFLVPLTGHVLADVLSEGTFLFFWTLGCWAAPAVPEAGTNPLALPHDRNGGTGILDASGGHAAALGSRGDTGGLAHHSLGKTGVAALVPGDRYPGGGTGLGAGSLRGVQGRNWHQARRFAAAGFVGTFAGHGRRARAAARSRPVGCNNDQACLQSSFRAVLGAVTAPLLLLALVSLRAPSQHDDRGRRSLFLLILLSGWLLALLRLHATGGYCTPRHALIFAFPVIAAAARGLTVVTDTLLVRSITAGATRHLQLRERPSFGTASLRDRSSGALSPGSDQSGLPGISRGGQLAQFEHSGRCPGA